MSDTLTPARQRELLLAFRDHGDLAAKAELRAGMPAAIRAWLDRELGAADEAVRLALAAAAERILDPLIANMTLAAVRAAEGVDLVADVMDPDELEDQLASDPVGSRALEVLGELAATAARAEAVTDATSEQRTKMIEVFAGHVLPQIRAHYTGGVFGVDHGQAQIDLARELVGRASSRISQVMRSVPDHEVLDDADGVAERLIGDPVLLRILGFDPRPGYEASRAAAERVQNKARAARAARPAVRVRASAPTPQRRVSSARRKPAVVLPPAPRPPSVLDALSPMQEAALLDTLRAHEVAWSRGDSIRATELRDSFWDPVTEDLEARSPLVLRQMLALLRVGRMRVARGLQSEVERVLAAKQGPA